MPKTRNVTGLVALRGALLAELRALEPDGWDRRAPGADRTVSDVVAHLASVYAEAAAGTLDGGDEASAPAVDLRTPEELIDGLQNAAELVESTFDDDAEARWDLPAGEVGRLDASFGSSTATLASEVLLHLLEIEAATGRHVALPEEAVDAAAAGVAWRMAEWLDGGVLIRFDDGDELVIGTPPIAATITTDASALVSLVGGRSTLSDLEGEGRFAFEGTTEARERFEESCAVSWGARD